MKRILVAPLHWGLGHATRCIPIINALINHKFEVILASDGGALELLKKEFPELEWLELPSYNISYSKKASQFKSKLIKSAPHILKTFKKEKKYIAEYLKTHTLDGIISDNRFGVRHKSIPSVFITHQLKVLSGNTTWLSTKLHQKMISKFDECWVPDHEFELNLSGDLGHPKHSKFNIKYIGPVSRFQSKPVEILYDLMVLLSGPEPQRTFLEEQLIHELKAYEGSVLFVKGIVESDQKHYTQGTITFYNFMTSKQLEHALNSSDLILSRSGYTTIMDLEVLDKKAFFIPTPGQFEQEYLAKRLNEKNIAPSCNQKDFSLKELERISEFSGFEASGYQLNFKKLFRLFQGE